MKNQMRIPATLLAITTLAFVLLFSALFMAACTGGQPAEESESPEENKISVVTTVFPVYDWVKNIVGDEDNVDVTFLLDKSVDLHSYQPTVSDIVRISTCDLFVYVGGESDEWVNDALKEAANQDMIVLNLLEELGDAVREEEVLEGMQEEEEEGEEEEVELDEHIWLSLKNASLLSDVIADALTESDPENGSVYRSNADAYIEALNALDKQYEAAVGSATGPKTLVFADRFPFLYLVKDYGISYYAAFVGCSAETEASFETVAFLAKKVDELQLKHILVIETSDQKIARTVRDTTEDKDQEILVMNSLQSMTAEKVAEGVSYLSLMEENLNVLKEALK